MNVSRSFSRPRALTRLALVIFPLLAAASCGSPNEPTPPPPPGSPPAISCPAALTATSIDGAAVAVNYPAPATTGGVDPVSVSCTHASGSAFPVGTTEVACTARDAQQRAASCGFTVTVNRPPQLTATSFLAFGDSLTEGKSGSCIRTLSGLRMPARLDLAFHPKLNNVPAGAEYPAVLGRLLSERYLAQSPVVVNEGIGGELASDSDAVLRLIGRVNVHRPQVLLLFEGVNDLNVAASTAGIPPLVGGLRTMMREARARGVAHVFLATLLPQRVGSCRAFHPELIVPANEAIRGLASNENAVLVDLHAAFAGQLDILLGEDGLHPTAAGYEAIARTFFAAIRERLEAPPP